MEGLIFATCCKNTKSESTQSEVEVAIAVMILGLLIVGIPFVSGPGGSVIISSLTTLGRSPIFNALSGLCSITGISVTVVWQWIRKKVRTS